MRMIQTAECQKGDIRVVFIREPDPNLPANEDPYTDYDHMRKYAGIFGLVINREGSPKRPISEKMAVYYSVRLTTGTSVGTEIHKIPGRLLKETR